MAFAEGIPQEITGDKLGFWFDHRLPHPEDNGIQFEKLEDFEELSQRLPFMDYASMVDVDRRLKRTLDSHDSLQIRHSGSDEAT